MGAPFTQTSTMNSSLQYHASADDLAFQQAFEALKLGADDFSHRAHLRLAYVLLCEESPDAAAERMRGSLLRFLAHLGVGEGKYHETLTQAWIDAVAHFMRRTEAVGSFDAFIENSPALLDTDVMLSHYAPERLFSEPARRNYLAPDRDPIPECRAPAGSA
jgi:hypothetical protein